MLKPLVAITAAVMISAPALAGDTLFSYGKKDYKLSDLQPNLQQMYYDNLIEAYERNVSLLDQAVLDIYIEKMAASKNKSIIEIRTALFKIEPPTDAELKAAYEQHKTQINQPFDQVKDSLSQSLEYQKAQNKFQSVIKDAKKKHSFELKMDEVEMPAFDMDLSAFPFMGAADAKVTIVEVADYRCHFCKQAGEAVAKVMDKYSDKVKLVYIDLPVIQPASGVSQAIMEGAYCARQQNKYWEYNKAAYAMQSELDGHSPALLADKLGLNKKTFEACMISKEGHEYVAKSQTFSQVYGVSSTPTFFINGQRMHTHDPVLDLIKRVEDALD